MLRRKSLRLTDRQSQVEALEARVVLTGDPLISEFQAANASTLADEDGDFSDWIEIHNPTAEAVDLSGWHLTDDAEDLNQWSFPVGTTLAADQYLVVFASNKDRDNPTGELHTNFRLSSGGEYLALVKPDGVTVVQQYDPYPAQENDSSYGLAAGREVNRMVDKDGVITAMVPTDDTLGTAWRDVAFDDSQWLTGAGGIGFEDLRPGFTDLNEFDNPVSEEWTIDRGRALVLELGGALIMNLVTGLETSNEERGDAPLVYRDIPSFPGEPDITPINWTMTAHMTQRQQDDGSLGLAVLDGDTGLPVIKVQYNDRARFEVRVNESREANVRDSSEQVFWLRIERDGIARKWTGYFKKLESDPWTSIGSVFDGIDGVPVMNNPKVAMFAETRKSTMRATFNYVEFEIPPEQHIYGLETGLDVTDQMYQQNGSVYVRAPFQLEEDPSKYDELALNLKFDDGYRAYLNGVLVSDQNAPLAPPPPAPNEISWDSSAAGTHGAINGNIPTTQIHLDEYIDELRLGENVLAIHGLNVDKDDRDFFVSSELLASDFVAARDQLFVSPTPGAANQVPAPLAPVVLGEEGLFFGSRRVEIELAEPAPHLEIRYTLDGSLPTQDSSRYDGPITLTNSAMLQARVIDPSPNPTVEPSPVAAATFIAADPALLERTSDIPIIVLDTLTQRVLPDSSNSLTPVNVLALDVSEATGRTSFDGIVDYLGRGGIRDRGSSTAGQAKNNLAFETWGPTGTTLDDDADVGLLGFAPESDWVLHAPFHWDRAMIRNQTTFSLSNQMDMWAPGTRAVEMYLNRSDGLVSEADYLGVYVLMDKVKQGQDRVDIAEINRDDNAEPEISGGYIWKIDRADPDGGSFPAGGRTFNWVYPKALNSRAAREDQKVTQEQQDWVTNHLNRVNDSLNTTKLTDPDGYGQYIDVDSWVDHHLISVFMDDVDAFALSAYLFKDRDSKIEMGPAWDFDRSAESLDDRDNVPDLWGSSGNSDFFTRHWYAPVFRDSEFWQVYVDRWTAWRRSVFSKANVDATLDELANEIAESQARNFDVAVNRGVRPRNGAVLTNIFNKLDGTWEGEVEHLRAWLHGRLEFFDSNFAQPPEFFVGGQPIHKVDQQGDEREGFSVAAGEEVEIRSAGLLLFEDAIVMRGEPGDIIASYFAPSDNTLGTQWVQPDFDDSSWPTGPMGLGFERSDDDFVDIIRTPITLPEGGTTLLTRTKFQVDDLATLQENDLILSLKYDDGIVVYLNGTEILQHKIRDTELAWDSRAYSRGSDGGAQVFEGFNITDYRHLLVEGENTLAIRVINQGSRGSDLLIQPQLSSRRFFTEINPQAKVYYTTDGTDPRAPGGQPSASAMLLPVGETVPFNQSTRVIARNLDDTHDFGPESKIVRTNWSAPMEFNVVVDSPDLVITEVNYNPTAATPAEELAGFRSSDFEFIEIFNRGATTADLVGMRFSDGVTFDFSNGSTTSLESGRYGLVAANQAAFESRYGSDLTIIGEYSGTLDNNGEDIDLINGLGEVVSTVNYADRDPWPVRADGFGATLELIDSNTTVDLQSKWYRWTASSVPGGTPGQGPVESVGVVINEVIANTRGTDVSDSIELLNRSNQAVDLTGWYLSDSFENPFAFAIPNGTVLQPGEYRVYEEDDFEFGLSAVGDSVWLVQRDNLGGIAAFGDDVHFGATETGVSLGRLPNGTGRLTALGPGGLNGPNTSHRVGQVVINEIQYNPVASEAALAVNPGLDPSDLEFVELFNASGSSVDLSDWRLRGGADINFDAETQLASGELLVLIKFNPENPENINRLNAFRAHYGIGEEVRLIGGYAGQFNNGGDRVVLQKPYLPNPDDPENIVFVPEDDVLFDDRTPWPTDADGTGASLQRIDPTAYGNDGASFFAALGNPGSRLGSGDFDGNGLLDANDIDLLLEQLRAPVPDVAFDLNLDGLVDAADRDVMVRIIFGTNYGDANLDGVFDSEDFVHVFIRGKYADGIALNAGWEDGDWDGDGDFESDDIVLAFQSGGYAVGARLAATSSDANGGSLQATVLARAALTMDDEAAIVADVVDQTSLEQEDSARRFELLDAAVESLFDNREMPTVETVETVDTKSLQDDEDDKSALV